MLAKHDDNSSTNDDWREWMDAREAEIQKILGPKDEMEGHATVPFYFGPEAGGAADIIYFYHHVPGVVAVTSDLIGCEDQPPNSLGNYELMICHRDREESWGANIISQLAHYTCQARLEPGETMDIRSALPPGSTLAALLFADYGRFQVRGANAGLLLCIGITEGELNACRHGRRAEVQERLETDRIWPYTDLNRDSVIPR